MAGQESDGDAAKLAQQDGVGGLPEGGIGAEFFDLFKAVESVDPTTAEDREEGLVCHDSS